MRYTTTILSILVAAFLLAACDSTLQVEPQQSVSTEVALGNFAGIDALASNMYDEMQNENVFGNEFVLLPDVLADNAGSSPNPSRYTGQVSNSDRAHFAGGWDNFYQAINTANQIIDRLDEGGGQDFIDNGDATQEEVDAILGEAYFVRGLMYFNLARAYGYEPGREVGGFDLAVPLRLEPTTSPADVERIPRSTNQDVYNQVVSDLQSAVDLLPVDNDRLGLSKAVGNRPAASGLLAQTYLYLENWEAAETAATQAIDSFPGSLTPSGDLVADFQDQNGESESLFELNLDPRFDGDVTFVNQSITSFTTPNPGNFTSLAPTSDLLSLYTADDVRADFFIESDGTTYINKYPGARNGESDNVPVLRLAEVYLIRAEARAEQNDDPGAISDLEALRENRITGDPSVPTGVNLIDFIMEERRRELAFEGERFFDLKRRGMDIPKPQSINVLPYRGDAISYRVLAPLPDNEVLNFGYTQNPGY